MASQRNNPTFLRSRITSPGGGIQGALPLLSRKVEQAGTVAALGDLIIRLLGRPFSFLRGKSTRI
jgi:hypothetical protein